VTHELRRRMLSSFVGNNTPVTNVPGALVWLLYPFAPPHRSAEHGEDEVMPAAGTRPSGAALDLA
jgi:hypothetical protein